MRSLSLSTVTGSVKSMADAMAPTMVPAGLRSDRPTLAQARGQYVTSAEWQQNAHGIGMAGAAALVVGTAVVIVAVKSLSRR